MSKHFTAEQLKFLALAERVLVAQATYIVPGALVVWCEEDLRLDKVQLSPNNFPGERCRAISVGARALSLSLSLRVTAAYLHRASSQSAADSTQSYCERPAAQGAQ
jgi:hypothetical protein